MLEGDEHRRLRKAISPAFSAQSLRALQPIYFEKAEELRDAMKHQYDSSGTESKQQGAVVMDVNNWLWRATLDIIGLAGFDYAFDAIKAETNTMYLAYRDLFQASTNTGVGARGILEIFFPWIATVFVGPSIQRVIVSFLY